MIQRFVIALAFIIALSAGASADSVWLKNGGMASGKIFEVQIKLGPLTRSFSRGQIKSLRIEGGEIIISATDGVKYTGKIGGVIIDADGGRMSFEGRSIKSLEIAPAETKAKAPLEWQAAAEKPEEDLKEQPARPVDKLRHEYLRKLREAEEKELKALRETYENKNPDIERLVQRLREECIRLGADPDEPGPAPSAEAWKVLQDLRKAQQERREFTKNILVRKNELARRAAVVRERINSYHAAILKENEELAEPAMRKIFEKAFSKTSE